MTHPHSLSLGESLLFDVFCALSVHRIYNKYEVDPIRLLPTFFLLVAVPALPYYLLAAHLKSIVLSLFLTYSLFYVTLLSSIVLYRISPMHPLAKYPGPLSLKISKFVAMYHASGGKQYTYFKSLHDTYGPFVRVGPNELSVVDTEAIPPILGLDGMRRGPLWDAHCPPGTTRHLLALRNVEQHNERRKLWNHGFTSASMKELQPAVESRVLELVEELGKQASREEETSLDLAQWMASFTYDFMGDMVFGGGFSFMRNGDEVGVRGLLEGTLKVIGLLEHAPWIVGLLRNVAKVSEKGRKYHAFGMRCYDTRKEQGATKRDLFHYITNEDGLERMEVPRDQGLNEIFAAIIAGADTTSTVLGGLFFHLLSNPAVMERLQKEVDSEFPRAEGEPFDAVKLAGMPYLNAVINEALRLQPPLPTSLQRSPLEGSGGKQVAGRFVPENTALYVPLYVLQRDSRYFSPLPNAFIPERWLDTTSGKFISNTSAFIPFSTGPANCVGKNLALLEMRMVVATIIQRFHVKFAEGYDPSKWEEELQDFFVTKVGRLPVIVTLRA
ncbi:hypothetical protein ACEPAF_4463 [Sanghuangporus sanghuang]